MQVGLGRGPLRGGEMGPGQMRQWRRSEVAIGDLKARPGLAQAIHDRGRKLAADGVGTEDTGVDMQKFHGFHPWYMFVTETI